MAEVARVLKPGGDFLLLIVEASRWTMLVSPPLAHHAKPDLARWRALLQQHGFTILDEGTQPLTRYWLARRNDDGIGIHESGFRNQDSVVRIQ
jgi:hypothetical protein